MENELRTAQAKAFYRSWQSFQEKYRVVAKSYSSDISLLELSVLIELQIDTRRSRSDFARLFCVTPQVLSRAVSRLLRRGFIRSSTDKADGRIKYMALTPKGTRELAAIDEEANEILREMTQSFSRIELLRFCELLAVLEQFFPAEKAVIRPAEDHPLRGAIRTFTRGFGLLGNKAFGIDEISTFEWHVLDAVRRGGGSTRSSDLTKRFHVPTNSVSVLLSRLEERTFLRRHVDRAGDLRSKLLVILPDGKELLERIEDGAVRLLIQAMKPLSRTEILELMSLMRRFVQSDLEEYQIPTQFTVRPIRNDRGAVVEMAIYLEDLCLGVLPHKSKALFTQDDILKFLTKIYLGKIRKSVDLDI